MTQTSRYSEYRGRKNSYGWGCDVGVRSGSPSEIDTGPSCEMRLVRVGDFDPERWYLARRVWGVL